MQSHEALQKSFDKLKGDHIELTEKNKNLELVHEALNLELLSSSSSHVNKFNASTFCDELTLSEESTSLEPFILKKYHKLKEEREMVMDGFERLTRGRQIQKDILSRNLINNVS